MIKTNRQAKQNKGMSGQHTRVRSGKPHKSCRYCGRQHEFTREVCLAFALIVIKGAIFQNSAEQYLTAGPLSNYQF